jgi:poly(3-hydroxybutyrate) depolymerase
MIASILRLSCLGLCLAAFPAHTAEPAASESLPPLAADTENLTVSGLSSGAFMAVQFHVAHSSLVRGAGILAGGPYYCARNSAMRAATSCMSPNFLMPAPKPDAAREEMDKQATAQRIDAPDNLQQSRVWLLSGGHDPLVKSVVVDVTQAFYQQWVPAAAIVHERLTDAGHAMIAPHAAGAGDCPVTQPPFINHCGDFDAPGQLLAHLLGDLQARAQTTTGELLAFQQSEFTRPESGMAHTGYVYIPADCRQGGCRIHVAYHGCRQNGAALGKTYVQESGYNNWAESNRLIVLYPQTSNEKESNGCWDWWGFTGPDYHLQSAPQIRAVRAMIDRLAAQP